MKKLIINILCICFLLNCYTINASAKEKSKNNGNKPSISQLAEYKMKGKGTREDPYIVPDDCPYKAVMDEKIQNLLDPTSEISLALEDISTTCYNMIGTRLLSINRKFIPKLMYDYNGALSIKMAEYTDGAFYQSNRDYPSLVSNGTLWIRHIKYVTPMEVQALYKAKTTPGILDIINSVATGGIFGSLLENKLTREFAAKKIT